MPCDGRSEAPQRRYLPESDQTPAGAGAEEQLLQRWPTSPHVCSGDFECPFDLPSGQVGGKGDLFFLQRPVLDTN